MASNHNLIGKHSKKTYNSDLLEEVKTPSDPFALQVGVDRLRQAAQDP